MVFILIARGLTTLYWSLRFKYFSCQDALLFFVQHPALYLRLQPILWRMWWRDLGANPYRLCRRYWTRLHGVSYAYGESPWALFAWLLRSIPWKKQMTFVDLGCGRGWLLWALHAAVGIKAIGVDQVPAFIMDGKKLRAANGAIDYICADAKTYPLRHADVIFLYLIDWDEEQVTQLAHHLFAYPNRWIVSVDLPLPHPFTEKFCVQNDTLTFSWGRGEVFLYRT